VRMHPRTATPSIFSRRLFVRWRPSDLALGSNLSFIIEVLNFKVCCESQMLNVECLCLIETPQVSTYIGFEPS